MNYIGFQVTIQILFKDGRSTSVTVDIMEAIEIDIAQDDRIEKMDVMVYDNPQAL